MIILDLHIHSPKDGHLSHSQFYTIANNMETNIFIHKSPCKCFSRYIISKSRIAGDIVYTFSTFLPYYSSNYLTNYLSHFYEISLYANIQSTFKYSCLYKIIYHYLLK